MSYRGYGGFYSILGSVRDAIVAEMNGRGIGMSRVAIMPGAISWDECEVCGMLALSITRFFLTENFPVEVTTADHGPTGPILGADLSIQAIRCAPQPAEGELAPSVSALNASSQEVLNDAWAVLCAVTTELASMEKDLEIAAWMIRQQMFVGPEGGCVGSDLAVAVGVEF
jgi:hypothetical protein